MSNDCLSPPTSGTFSVNVTDPCGGQARHMKVGTVLYIMKCVLNAFLMVQVLIKSQFYVSVCKHSKTITELVQMEHLLI